MNPDLSTNDFIFSLPVQQPHITATEMPQLYKLGHYKVWYSYNPPTKDYNFPKISLALENTLNDAQVTLSFNYKNDKLVFFGQQKRADYFTEQRYDPDTGLLIQQIEHSTSSSEEHSYGYHEMRFNENGGIISDVYHGDPTQGFYQCPDPKAYMKKIARYFELTNEEKNLEKRRNAIIG